MGSVRRYNVELEKSDGKLEVWYTESESGEFVEYSEFKKLENENRKLREQVAGRKLRVGVKKLKVASKLGVAREISKKLLSMWPYLAFMAILVIIELSIK